MVREADGGSPVLAPPAHGDAAGALARAWDLKQQCYAAWTSEPQRAAQAADALRQLADAWPTLHRWLAADGQLVLAQNGLPWWYFADAHGQLTRHLRAADPDGRRARVAFLSAHYGFRDAATPMPGTISPHT